MAVRIRLKKMGRLHRPFFRINACDSHAPRDGKVLECLGTYDPLEKDDAKQLVLDRERVVWWLDQGAQPSDTVWSLFKRVGIHPHASRGRKPSPRPEAASEPEAQQ